jgi:DNA-binding CsgD family transcriptional regulator
VNIGANCVEAKMSTLVAPEVVVGLEQIDLTLRGLVSETSLEVATFATGGAHSDDEIRETQSRNAAMYDKGIRSRTIYLASVRNDKPTLDHVRWLNERGSEVRTTPTLPTRMIVCDRKTAVLPLDPAYGLAGLIIHRHPSVVAPLQALFEVIWNSATPLGLTITGDHPLSEEERVLLDLLAVGTKDSVIAKKLGVATRTVERRIAKLCARLGAKTRFEAAYRAGKRNWI